MDKESKSIDLVNSPHTCITCRVVFAKGDLQREHYKSDWHRYNLKRKVAELPPVTASMFQNKVLAQRQEDEDKSKEVSFRCESCNKSFQSKETYESHSRSKKHSEIESKRRVDKKETITKPSIDTVAEPATVNESVEDEDGWETDEEDMEGGDGIPPSNCLFCSHSSSSKDAKDNLAHMSLAHGFFIPDAEYCTDIEGLLTYLGAKVGMGYVCLWCNQRGRSFQSLDAVQKHMRDKGHCKVLHEGEAVLEYSDFYDYSPSYPDAAENQDTEAELDETDVGALEERGWQLVLPSGTTIGHRSLMRYYRQRLKPENQVQIVNKRSKPSAVLLNQYRALGWTGTSGEAAVRKAKDLAVVNKIMAKHRLKVGLNANKFQPHFRRQVNF